jgi:hypothetical protein
LPEGTVFYENKQHNYLDEGIKFGFVTLYESSAHMCLGGNINVISELILGWHSGYSD